MTSGHTYCLDMVAVSTALESKAKRLENYHVAFGLFEAIYIMTN